MKKLLFNGIVPEQQSGPGANPQDNGYESELDSVRDRLERLRAAQGDPGAMVQVVHRMRDNHAHVDQLGTNMYAEVDGNPMNSTNISHLNNDWGPGNTHHPCAQTECGQDANRAWFTFNSSHELAGCFSQACSEERLENYKIWLEKVAQCPCPVGPLIPPALDPSPQDRPAVSPPTGDHGGTLNIERGNDRNGKPHVWVYPNNVNPAREHWYDNNPKFQEPLMK